MNVKEELLEILEELHPDIDFAEEDNHGKHKRSHRNK